MAMILKPTDNLSVVITKTPQMSSVIIGPPQIKTKVQAGGSIQYPVYSGEYSVTPSWDAQTLATENKVLKKDVSIKRIPTYSVSNIAGGETFVIGEMEDI